MCSTSSLLASNRCYRDLPRLEPDPSLQLQAVLSIPPRFSKEDALFNEQAIQKHLASFKIEELKSNIKTLETNATKLSEDIGRLNPILEEFSSKLEKLDELLAQQTKTAQNINIANEKLQSLQKQISNLNTLEELDKFLELSSHSSTCGGEIRDLKVILNNINDLMKAFPPRERLVDTIGKIKKEISQLETNRNVINEKIHAFEQQKQKTETSTKALQQGIKAFKSLYPLEGSLSFPKKVILSNAEIPLNLEVLKQDQRCLRERIEKTETQRIALEEQASTTQNKLANSEGSLIELENTKKQIESEITFMNSTRLLIINELNEVQSIMKNRQQEIAQLDLTEQNDSFDNLTVEINSQIRSFRHLKTKLEAHDQSKTVLTSRQEKVAAEIHLLNLTIVEMRRTKETINQQKDRQEQEVSIIKKQEISLKKGIAYLEEMQEENTLPPLPALIPPRSALVPTSAPSTPPVPAKKSSISRSIRLLTKPSSSSSSSSSSSKTSPTKRTRDGLSNSSSTNISPLKKPRALSISGENQVSMDDDIPDFVALDFHPNSFHHFITSRENLTLKNIVEFLTNKSEVEKRAEINRIDQGCAPIHLLIQRCDSDADVDLLVEFMKNYEPDCTIKAQGKWLPIDLFSTCEHLNHETRAKKIIAAFNRLGASLEGSGVIKPLNLSICQEYNIIASALIEAGVSIKGYDHWGLAPIHYIAISGNLEMLKLFKIYSTNGFQLLNQLCEVRYANPLIYASNYAHKACVNFLLEGCKDPAAYVDIDLKDFYEWSCLDYVEHPFHTDGRVPVDEREIRKEIAETLRKYGVDAE